MSAAQLVLGTVALCGQCTAATGATNLAGRCGVYDGDAMRLRVVEVGCRLGGAVSGLGI